MNLRKQGLLKMALFAVVFGSGLRLNAIMPATMATNVARFMDLIRWSQSSTGVNVLRSNNIIWSAEDQNSLLSNLTVITQQLNLATPNIPLLANSSQFWGNINGYAKSLTMSLFNDLYTYYSTTNLASYPVLANSLSAVLTTLQGSARAMPNSFNQAFQLQNRIGYGLTIPSVASESVYRGGSSMSATLSRGVSKAAKY